MKQQQQQQQPPPPQKFNILKEALPILSRLVYMLCYFGVTGAIYGGFIDSSGEALDASFWIGVFIILAAFFALLDRLERTRAAAAGTPYEKPPQPETATTGLQTALTSVNVISWIMYIICFLGIAGAIYGGFIVSDSPQAPGDASFWIGAFILWAVIVTALDRATPLTRQAEPPPQQQQQQDKPE